MVEIHNWALQSVGDDFTAPECRSNSISGKVTNHSSQPDGQTILTSHPVRIQGRVVTTRSGNQYRLVGRPRKEFELFMKEKGILYDVVHPFRSLREYLKSTEIL